MGQSFSWGRDKLVYGDAGLHVAADEVGGDDGQHVAADEEVVGDDGQQVEGGAGHLDKPAGHGQGQQGVRDEIDKEEVGVPGELRKVLAEQVVSFKIMESRKNYEDFEENIYLQHALKIDWKEVDDDENLISEEIKLKMMKKNQRLKKIMLMNFEENDKIFDDLK